MQNELKPCPNCKSTNIDFQKFNGKKIEEVAKHLEDISYYNNNYYEDDEGNIIYAWSDDDNYTEYTQVVIVDGKKQYLETFAESFTSNNDVMQVFDRYINEVFDNAE